MIPFIQQLKLDAEEGNRDPLEILIELRELESELDEAITAVTPLAVNQADKYPGKSFTFHGLIIEKRDGTRRWSFPDFAPYVQTKNRQKALEDLMIRVSNTGLSLVDAETGEIVPAATVTYSKPTIAIKGVK